MANDSDKAQGTDFIRARIEEDNKTGRFGGKVHTRFPPEPNGYLHLGHAKSICLNFGVAKEFGGQCNLRFDDTNPVKEEDEYVHSIAEDVAWLGGDWEDRKFFASDYFERFYEYAEDLIRKGKAYVDDLSADEIREYRGTLTSPGRESPWRNRGVEENLDLFKRMRGGEFADGEKVLRAKIDMASPNIIMRDPTIYRIRHASHHRTGEKWAIYPMYDFAHCISDSIEGITHSLCTLEFVNNRELYDWVLDALEIYHPQQIEFARLNLTLPIQFFPSASLSSLSGMATWQVGMIRECLRFLACGGGACRLPQFGNSVRALAWPGLIPRLSIQCSSIAYAKSSTKVRQG